MTDVALFAIIRERRPRGVTGDVLDVAGFTHELLPPGIRALQPDMMLIGRAMPALTGSHRETRAIKVLGFPIFPAGSYAQDQRLRGRVSYTIGADHSTQSMFYKTGFYKTKAP